MNTRANFLNNIRGYEIAKIRAGELLEKLARMNDYKESREYKNIERDLRIVNDGIKYFEDELYPVYGSDFYTSSWILDPETSIEALECEELEELFIMRVQLGYLGVIFISDNDCPQNAVEIYIDNFGTDINMVDPEDLEFDDSYEMYDSKVVIHGGMLGVEIL